MKTQNNSSLAAGVFLASYSLFTWLYPTGVTARSNTPTSAITAVAREEAVVVLASAAPGVPEVAAGPAASLLPAEGEQQRAATRSTLPRIVAVDRHIAARTDQLRPNVKKRLAHAARSLPEGVTLLVTSAYRTYEEQTSLQPTFGVKAAPGTSTHEHGRGIDLNVLVDGERMPPREQQKIIGEAMADAGFRHLGPADPVHYSIPERELGPEPAQELRLEVPTLDEARAELELETGGAQVAKVRVPPSG